MALEVKISLPVDIGEFAMNQIYVDEGLLYLLNQMLANDIILHLYTNNVTPDHDTILGDLVEAVFTGYAPITLHLADWVFQGVNAHQGFALAGPVGFLNSSGSDQSAFGYYFTDALSTFLIAAVRFNAAPIVKHDAQTFPVIPTWGDFSEF